MSQQPNSQNVTAARPRPNAKWVCGYESIGLACIEGPDDQGVCCQLRKDSQRAAERALCDEKCSCADTCELSQLRRAPRLPSHAELGPCIPRRSAWFSRQTLMLNVAILTGGLLLLSMTLPQREAIFVPGGLSNKHAQILGNHIVSQRCSACHPNSHTNVAGMGLQDELCMKCHTSHFPTAAPRSPHDLPRGELAKLTAQAIHFRASTQAAVDAPAMETSCAMCHVEHRGAGFDLKAVSDANCQACHQRQFESLANGHPPLENFPYREQRQVAFDHAAHADKYFGTKNEKFECSRCHVDRQQHGELGSVFRAVGFDKACGSCHLESIKSATINGWALLQLPSLEAADAREDSLGLMDWPAAARFGYEGEISVPLRMLLAADPKLRPALIKLPTDSQLQSMRDDPEARATTARTLARGLRRLVAEVAAEGQLAWTRRLRATAQYLLNRELNDRELAVVDATSQGIPPDLFRQMEVNWFGNPTGIVGKPRVPLKFASSPGGPDGLLSERRDDSLLDDSLLEGPAADELDADEWLRDGGSTDGASSNESSEARQPAEEDSSATAAAALTRLRGSLHVAAGGWYLDHDLLALRYMPRGHADTTLAAWAEYVAMIDQATSLGSSNRQSAENELARSRLGRSLTRGVAVPGNCTQCHLLDPTQAMLDEYAMWTCRRRAHAVRSFTKFDHTPHLTLPALSRCSYCHELQTERLGSLKEIGERQLQAPSGIHPHAWTQAATYFLSGEFRPMHLEQCSACHRPGGANDACTQCHNYHISSPDSR